jgi:hypothetical protein
MPTGQLVDAKYGRITVENVPDTPFHEDEPAFVFRGQDGLSVSALEGYLQICEDEDASPEHCAMVARSIEEVSAWQDAHPELLKIPS